MIEVSFQGETHHCFANNPQSDAGSDTQDTNTMTSAAAASRQQNGGSTEQWENVPLSSLEHPNAHKYTKKHSVQMWRTCKRAHRRRYCTITYQTCSTADKNSCMYNISLLSRGSWCSDRKSMPRWFEAAEINITGTAGKLKTWGTGADPSWGPLLKTLDVSLCPAFLLNLDAIRLTS